MQQREDRGPVSGDAVRCEGGQREEGLSLAQSVVAVAVDEAQNAWRSSPSMLSALDSLWGYCGACMRVRSLDNWLLLNKQHFGCETLYAGELAGGALFGYAAGVTIKKAVKLGVVMAGLGFFAAQTLSYYGFFKLPSSSVGEVVQSSLDAVGASKLQDPQTIKLRLRQILGGSGPPTAGFSIGLAWALLKG